jgi:cytochrome c oxidase subunit III
MALQHTFPAGHIGSDVHGPSEPPHYGGGDRGHGPDEPGYYERRRRYRLGVVLALVSVGAIFTALTVAYVFVHNNVLWDPRQHVHYRHWLPLPLPVELLLINSVVLLISSFTLEMARRNVTHRAVTAMLADIPGVAWVRDRSLPWLGATVLLGGGFLAGQLMAWQRMQHAGFYLATVPSSSFFYLLTATHGLHLAGGILVLLYAAAASVLHHNLTTRRIVLDAAAWYWHFMAALWVYVFALMYFAK